MRTGPCKPTRQNPPIDCWLKSPSKYPARIRRENNMPATTTVAQRHGMRSRRISTTSKVSDRVSIRLCSLACRLASSNSGLSNVYFYFFSPHNIFNPALIKMATINRMVATLEEYTCPIHPSKPSTSPTANTPKTMARLVLVVTDVLLFDKLGQLYSETMCCQRCFP